MDPRPFDRPPLRPEPPSPPTPGPSPPSPPACLAPRPLGPRVFPRAPAPGSSPPAPPRPACPDPRLQAPTQAAAQAQPRLSRPPPPGPPPPAPGPPPPPRAPAPAPAAGRPSGRCTAGAGPPRRSAARGAAGALHRRPRSRTRRALTGSPGALPPGPRGYGTSSTAGPTGRTRPRTRGRASWSSSRRRRTGASGRNPVHGPSDLYPWPQAPLYHPRGRSPVSLALLPRRGRGRVEGPHPGLAKDRAEGPLRPGWAVQAEDPGRLFVSVSVAPVPGPVSKGRVDLRPFPGSGTRAGQPTGGKGATGTRGAGPARGNQGNRDRRVETEGSRDPGPETEGEWRWGSGRGGETPGKNVEEREGILVGARTPPVRWKPSPAALGPDDGPHWGFEGREGA